MMQGITKSEMKNIWKELFIEILKIYFRFISLEILWWSLSNITEEIVLAANILGFYNYFWSDGIFPHFHCVGISHSHLQGP